ncbi:MAG: fumarate hydratase [Nanoarchaeota archaeon]|nr:fumarate hydratase [Nanoarchaeota archaeon]
MIKQRDIIGLYKKLVTEVPPYIESAINESIQKEQRGSLAWDTQRKYLLNLAIAKDEKIPICQDTGIPKFLIKLPRRYSTRDVKNTILDAMPIATEEAYARQSGIDPLSKKETGNEGITTFYFDEWDNKYPQVSLLLKNSICRNLFMTFS